MIRVLQSFREGRTTTNPYLLQLVQSLGPLVQVRGFSWRPALAGHYDVLHVHWPEVLLRGSTVPRTWARRILFCALLLRIRLSHIAIVRTLHNVDPHEPGPWAERILLRACDRQTTLWIRLNPTTELPLADRPAATIPHGDYREWFVSYPRPPAIAGRLLSFGLLRRYKGVDALLDAFHTLSGPELSLHVVGAPESPGYAEHLRLDANRDPRITLTLDHVGDSALAREIGEAELVVLPYRQMHNSGAVLLALSLARPVLVPSNTVTELLREEVGGSWVQTYRGPLTARTIHGACVVARQDGDQPLPDLTLRSWPDIAAQHSAAYLQAVRVARGR